MNAQAMIKKGMIIAVGADYLTDDGRIIRRTPVYGRRRPKIKWRVEGKDFIYNTLFEAYEEYSW